MGILTHYFAATDDETAAACAAHPDGPGDDREPARTTVPGTHDAVPLSGLEPFVMLGTLASMLTGRTYGEVTRHPRHGGVVASAGDEGPWVVSVSDELVGALAMSTRTVLERVADRWATPSERSRREPEQLAGALHELAELCARAREAGHRVYCWTCL
ncbi:hypothetical protein IF650_18530 [Cellulosimicrobium terreum]|nr:hypothetical protein [Cellulosimicrobium terreum]